MRRAASLTATLALVLVAGCGSPSTPTVEPGADPPTDTDATDTDAEPGADGASDPAAGSQLALGTPGCPPVLGPDDPDPFGGGGGAGMSGEWISTASELVEGELADRTGGLYLDQEEGELVVVAVGPDPEATVDEVRAAVPDEHRDLVVCRHGALTTAELTDILDVAMAAADGPLSGGVDTVRNRVTVQLEVGDAEELRAAVADELGHEASAALAVEVPPCAADGEAEVPEDAVPLPGGGSNCGGMDALASGTLGGDPATGCLTLGTGDLEEPLAWPIGWYVTPDGTIHDHTGQPRAELGDEVELGGGFTPVVDGGACGWGEGETGSTNAEPGGAFLINSVEVVG